METYRVIDMVKEVMKNGDTVEDIICKIMDYFPFYFEKNHTYFKSEYKALKQMRAEVFGVLSSSGGKVFTVDKSEEPYRYNLV